MGVVTKAGCNRQDRPDRPRIDQVHTDESAPPHRMAPAFLPPAMVDAAAWDILLALHADAGRGLGVRKLAGLASVSPCVVAQWLALFRQRHLVTDADRDGAERPSAVLSAAGRKLLDRYLSATVAMQRGGALNQLGAAPAETDSDARP